jgi:hypothetical protein
VKKLFADHSIQPLLHPPIRQIWLRDFFLFRRVKEELASLSLDEHSLKKTWEGVVRTITADEFATAFRRGFER